jgi:hypothetical protein
MSIFTMREQRRRVGVAQQSVIAGPQLRVHQKIEGPPDRAQFLAQAGRRSSRRRIR